MTKQYSLNDLRKGDIYEHYAGGHYEITCVNKYERTIETFDRDWETYLNIQVI